MSDNKLGIILLIGIILWWILFYIFVYLIRPDLFPYRVQTLEQVKQCTLFLIILIGSCFGIPILYALIITLTRENHE